jgi:hypothetical protein
MSATEDRDTSKTRNELEKLLRKLDSSLSALRVEIDRVRKAIEDDRTD